MRWGWVAIGVAAACGARSRLDAPSGKPEASGVTSAGAGGTTTTATATSSTSTTSTSTASSTTSASTSTAGGDGGMGGGGPTCPGILGKPLDILGPSLWMSKFLINSN